MVYNARERLDYHRYYWTRKGRILEVLLLAADGRRIVLGGLEGDRRQRIGFGDSGGGLPCVDYCCRTNKAQATGETQSSTTEGRKTEGRCKKQAALARQKELEDKYADSPLTRKIIEAISDGTGRLPEEITIYDDRVTGRTNGQMRTFDFATNRVPFFKPSCFIPTNTDYHLLFGSKVALGNAINRILHEQYEVHDDHRHDADHRYNDNHEWVPVTRYTSNHVLLRLKATNHW